MLAVAVTAAVVVSDHVALRASADRTAAQQAVLWKGDWLEVRGQKKGWLKVYDHRHDRAGWIAAKNVKQVELEEASAPAVRSIVEFLRDTPGQESLGIAYAAIYLKVAPKAAIDAAMMLTHGSMADRLARRASASGGDATAAEQLEVARSWGIVLDSVEQPDGARISLRRRGVPRRPRARPRGERCGDRGARADRAGLRADDARRERARRARRGRARAARARRSDDRVHGPMGNELRVRRAEIAAQLAWARGAQGRPRGGGEARRRRGLGFARVDKAELAEDDEAAYASSAIAVAASRWAAMPAAAIPGLALTLTPGEPGETCVSVKTPKGAESPAKCTHGQVWDASLRANKDRSAAVLAIEPLPGWLELWMFRRGADGGWMVDVLAPSTDGPDLGYVELAGWSPDGGHALIVREARADGAVKKSYETITLATLAVDHASSTLAGSGAKQWANADWRGRTLALR